MLDKMNELSPSEKAAQKAYDDAQAKVDAFNKITAAIAAKAAEDVHKALKELDLEYSDFHRKWARKRNRTNQVELFESLKVELRDAADLPDPEDEGLDAMDNAYWRGQ